MLTWNIVGRAQVCFDHAPRRLIYNMKPYESTAQNFGLRTYVDILGSIAHPHMAHNSLERKIGISYDRRSAFSRSCRSSSMPSLLSGTPMPLPPPPPAPPLPALPLPGGPPGGARGKSSDDVLEGQECVTRCGILPSCVSRRLLLTWRGAAPRRRRQIAAASGLPNCLRRGLLQAPQDTLLADISVVCSYAMTADDSCSYRSAAEVILTPQEAARISAARAALPRRRALAAACSVHRSVSCRQVFALTRACKQCRRNDPLPAARAALPWRRAHAAACC